MKPRIFLGGFVALYCFFAVSPVLIILTESVTSAMFVSFPPVGFSLRWYMELGERPEFISSLYISVVLAALTSVLATAFGAAASLALVRYRFFGRDLLQGLFMSPLSLPAMVLGIALLQFYAANGIHRGLITLLLAHMIITIPFSIRLVTASLTGFDRGVELAAQSLGADRFNTFRLVTLPLIRSGIIGSVVFTFIISFDEVALSLFLSTAQVTPIPVRIFTYIEQLYDPFITAVSSILILFVVVLIAILERTVGIARLFGVQ